MENLGFAIPEGEMCQKSPFFRSLPIFKLRKNIHIEARLRDFLTIIQKDGRRQGSFKGKWAKMVVFLVIYRNFKGVKPARKGGVLPRARDSHFSATCQKDTWLMDKKGEV